MNRKPLIDSIIDVLCAFAVLSLVGWVAIVVATIAVSFLVFIARLALLAIAIVLTPIVYLERRRAVNG